MTLIQKMQALAGSAVLVSSVATFVSYSNSLLDINEEETEEETNDNPSSSGPSEIKDSNYVSWTFSDWASGNEASNSGWF